MLYQLVLFIKIKIIIIFINVLVFKGSKLATMEELKDDQISTIHKIITRLDFYVNKQNSDLENTIQAISRQFKTLSSRNSKVVALMTVLERINYALSNNQIDITLTYESQHQFLKKYEKFSGYEEDVVENLMCFANCMSLLTKIVPSRGNKDILLNAVYQFVGKWTGCSCCHLCIFTFFVVIIHTEGTPYTRGGMKSKGCIDRISIYDGEGGGKNDIQARFKARVKNRDKIKKIEKKATFVKQESMNKPSVKKVTLVKQPNKCPSRKRVNYFTRQTDQKKSMRKSGSRCMLSSNTCMNDICDNKNEVQPAVKNHEPLSKTSCQSISCGEEIDLPHLIDESSPLSSRPMSVEGNLIVTSGEDISGSLGLFSEAIECLKNESGMFFKYKLFSNFNHFVMRLEDFNKSNSLFLPSIEPANLIDYQSTENGSSIETLLKAAISASDTCKIFHSPLNLLSLLTPCYVAVSLDSFAIVDKKFPEPEHTWSPPNTPPPLENIATIEVLHDD